MEETPPQTEPPRRYTAVSRIGGMIGAFILLAMFGGSIYGLLFYDVPEHNREALGMLLGTLAAAITALITYMRHARGDTED